LKVPVFIENTPDDKHCVQSCVGMVLNYFLPGRTFSMPELERFTGFVEGKGAWEMQELLNYSSLGLSAQVIVNMSYEEFAKRDFAYLAEVLGDETAEWAKSHTGDIGLEKQRAAEVAQSGLHIYREPNEDDICSFVEKDWLVMLEVNVRKLNNKEGFSGHRVLVYDATKGSGVVMHDPGLPPQPSRQVDWDLLEKSWADPNEYVKTLIAVGRINS
jgi:hypothetical protein